MRFIEELCPPALLYLIFLVVQLGLDLGLGLWVTFAVKLIVGLFFVYLLNVFCGIGLTPVSWFIVAAPFFITALATAMSMQLNLDEIIIIQNTTPSRENFVSGDGSEIAIDFHPRNTSDPSQVVKMETSHKRWKNVS